jgi:hypothetical protein
MVQFRINLAPLSFHEKNDLVVSHGPRTLYLCRPFDAE